MRLSWLMLPFLVAGGSNLVSAQAAANNVNAQQDDPKNHIIGFEACKEDIHKYCTHEGVDLKSDISIIECLQDAGQKETATLTNACESLVWDFKKRLTQDERFLASAKKYCEKEMQERPAMARCQQETQPGYALSCMIDFVANITQTSECYAFLFRTERLAFSDFRLVAPFIQKCDAELKTFKCEVITPDKAHKGVRVPHTQGMALECLIQQLVKEGNKQGGNMPTIGDQCKHEVMRLAEMQADDFHLDRPLFFACREDREKFCANVPAGQGKIFECLIVNRNKAEMNQECSKILVERAHLMGRDYRMAHPLSRACQADIKKYSCEQENLDAAVHFHLTWILLCLENGAKTQPQNAPSKECQHEMLTHRQMMMTEFRIAPEVVLNCANEIDSHCSPKGDIEAEGRTLHCLMALAEERVDQDKRKLGPQCMQALKEVVKIADIGSNYKVDKVLYASCKDIIDGPCQQDAESEAATLQCLMKNVDSDKMTPQCEQRLIEVQYFMARDWALDPGLYKACHNDATTKCSASADWHLQSNKAGADPGPQVLACLYRSAYDEQNQLSGECTNEVRRVLRERAVRVALIPEIEESCRGALSEFCSDNIAPQEEMQCLQDHFEEKDFIGHYKQCYDEVKKFTEMEAKDTKLNRLLTRACKPVIEEHCVQFKDEDIDHGDVLECLVQHKDSKQMNSKCRSYVHHFELISMRDYHFSFRFQQACGPDITKHCKEEANDKGSIIRCLSEVQFLHRVLKQGVDLDKECKKQLKVAYLEQEQVDLQFDDKEHMKEADPNLFKKCEREIQVLQCKGGETFEDVIECLREGFDKLGPECKAMVFDREKFEAADNTLDDELQRLCAPDIRNFCQNVQPDRVLDCLTNSKVVRMLKKPCQKIVHERMREQAKDVRLRPGLLAACQKEADLFCKEGMDKLKDKRYSEQTLDGVVINCLRDEFRKSIGGSKPHFSPECTAEISKVILETEFDIQLDPPLYNACEKAIHRHCSDEIIGKSGHYDTVLECLKADFYKGVLSDKNCAEELAKRTQESLIDIHLDPVLHEACAVDIQRYCREVPPGEGRVISCLIDASQNSRVKMSPGCQTKLTERNSLWQTAHQEYHMALPETFGELVDVIRDHPNKTSILSWLALFVVVILVLGCCCGRATKRVARELKNR